MTIEFGAFAPSPFAGDSNQPFLQAQFRNPLIPNNPNEFGLTVPTSSLEGGTAGGDSGGPVFIQTAAGLVQIGTLTGGFNPLNPANPSIYGDISLWTPLALFLDWVAQNNPLRQVTAAAGNFNWSNPAAWIDSVPGVPSRVPDNTRGSVDINANDVRLQPTGTGASGSPGLIEPAMASTGGHRRPPCAGELLPEGEGHALSSLTSRVATPPASSRSRAIALSTAWRSAGVMARSRTSSRTRSSWRGAVRAMCLQVSSVLRASGNRASILCLLRDDVAVRGDQT